MPLQAFPVRQNDETGGTRRPAGHVSGRALSGVTAVTAPAEELGRSARRRPSERHAGLPGPLHSSVQASAGTGRSRRASASSGGQLSSEDSYEAAPPGRRSQPINAELVKLVASFAPLELAQLKAMEQKARIKKARAPAAAALPAAALADPEPGGVAAAKEEEARTELQRELAQAGSTYPAAPPPAEQPLEPARLLVRPSTADATRVSRPSMSAAAGKTRSQSATRPSHLPAAPAKGAVVKRDLNILPNPVAQKQTEAIQRQAAVSAFVKRLQREQDQLRAEKERRLKAEQDAMAAQLDEEAREAKAAAAEVTRVAAVPSVPVRRKKLVPPSSGVNTALKDMQAAAQDVPEKKPADPKPWRQNMRRQKNPPVAGEAPIGAPLEVPAKAATGAPPPRNVSPGAAAARAKTLDPVARAQLKDYMERKAKDMAAKQLQERAAQQEAKIAQMKVIKEEMVKARERAQKYAEATKENPPDFKGPRPAWVDIVPPEAGSATAAPASRVAPSQRLHHGALGPDYDYVSERPMPYHMSDAMRMEAAERRRQERQLGSTSPARSRGGRPLLVDNYGHSLADDDDWDGGPQVVRVHDPEAEEQAGRAYRAVSARPARPVANPAPTLAQAIARQIQVGQPIAPETLRTIDLEARLAARKKYEQRQRELQAAERRDSSRGRDTSRGRDNSRGRRRSPTTGRKHEATSLNSRSRSPPKRAKQQVRRSRSASRAGSANRRPPAAELQSVTAPSRGSGRPTPMEHPTAIEAEMQQARNERQVDNLWSLALQLSARLGALQQQGMLTAPQQPMQAWPDPQAQTEQQRQLLQQQQQVASLRGSMAGPLLPYPPPVAVVPTGLPTGVGPPNQDFAGPRQMQQYDEAVEADIEFRTDASWPIPGHKKPRTTGSSSAGFGADSSLGLGAHGSLEVAAGVRGGAPTSLFSGNSMGAQSHGNPDDGSLSDFDTAALDDNVSMLTSGLHATSVAAETASVLPTTNMSSGVSQSSLSAHSRDQDGESLLARSSPAHRARSLNEEMRSRRPASAGPVQSRASIPSSPSRQVPAAPVIQIPLPVAASNGAADSLGPSVAGLPYDNATFSAESADEDGSSSGGESTYGQRVLTIAELHSVLEDNPRLAQRLSLDRERDMWEEVFEASSPSRSSGIRVRPPGNGGGSVLGRPEVALPSPSYGGTSDDSLDDSGPGTPARPCDTIVNEYEHANSPLRLRPAQRELLKAVKRAEEQLGASESESFVSGTEDESEDLNALQLPKSGDPMSIISLLAHKGRLPARPTIIQLSESPVLGGSSPARAEQETQTAGAPAGSDPAAQSVTTRRTSEVLLIPGPKGPQLVFSRELLHLQQHPQLQSQQLAPTLSPSPKNAMKETGEGRVDHEEPYGSSAQQLTDSMPPFVLVSAAVTTTTTAAPASPVLRQSVNTAVLHNSRAASSPSSSSPAVPAGPMQHQLDLMRSLHQQQLEERGLSEPLVRGEQRRRSAPGVAHAAAEGPDDGGSGPLGAMASPPPRARMVTFLDEVQGPPERVRLAPGELFNQMQNTLKTYEELDAAESELQQLQNARAIAAVQREAHRIAQRLDQSTAAEAQLQLIAKTQAEMDAKLHAFETAIRDEVRKDSLGHLHDVTSLFVEQLNRNKVVHMHNTAQTTPQPPSPPKPDVGVQVGPPLAQHPVSILRSGSPHQQQPQQVSRSPSPQTSLRPISPAQTLLQQSSALSQESPGSRGGSPGPGGRTSAVSFQHPSFTTSNHTTEYSEDFEEEMRQSSYVSGRSASRVSFRQASHLSVPESVSEEVGEESADGSGSGSEVEDELGSQRASRQASLRTTTATSIPESVLHYRERQLSRASNRQTSFASVAESIPSERPPSRSALRQQTSTLSVPESVTEEQSAAPSRQPFRSALRQQSTVSVAESVGFAASGRRSSGGGTESVPYSSVGVFEARGTSSIQESLPARYSGRASATLSGASRRRRSAIEEDMPSEPTYSTAFEKDEEDRISEEDFVHSRTGARSTRDDDDDYSTDEVASEEESYIQRSSERRGTVMTASARSEVEELIKTASAVGVGGSRSNSRDDDVAEDSGLAASGSSPHVQSRQGRSAAAGGSLTPPAHSNDVADVMTTPPSARTAPRRGDAMLAGASPLSLRASMDGGLELDDDVMTSYAADAEKRMRQEVALLQDRLQDINRRAAAKTAQLESELAAEVQPQKRQALIRAQRLLQVQHDADAADIQRQISAIKADYSRQRLMLERLVRLAELTKRAGATPAGDGRRPERDRAGAAALEPRPAGRAPHASGLRSVDEEVPSEQLPSRSGSGGVHTTTSSIAEESSRQARRPTSSGSVGEDIPKGSRSSEIAEEYSDQFEPSIKQSRSQLLPPGGRPPRPRSQPSSIVSEIEESLSGRRPEASGTHSQSVATEDNFKRSGSSAATKTQRPNSGSVATESTYSEDFDASGGSAKPPARTRASQRRGATSARSDDLDSELSALSLKLEREKAELARKLQERRRAKIQAKQAEVEQMRRKLAALEGKAMAPARPTSAAAHTAPARRKPSTVSDADSESDIEDQVSGYSRSRVDDSGSKAPSTEVDMEDGVQSVGESGIAEESEIDDEDDVRSAPHSSIRSRSGVSVSASPDEHTTSTIPSREPIDPDLAAAEKDIEALKAQIERAKKERLAAAERQKRKLQAELEALTSDRPVSRPTGASEPRRAAAAPVPAPRSYGTSTDSASYSQEFSVSGTVSVPFVPGAKSSSSVLEEVSQSTLQRAAGQAAYGSRSKSISEERVGSIQQSSRGAGSHSGSVQEDETQRTGLYSSRSSGGGPARGAGQSSNSSEMYDESFETDSMRGFIPHESSGIQDEVGASSIPSSNDPTGASLEPIREEDVRSVSGHSISYAADSVINQSVRESSVYQGSEPFGGFPAAGGDTRSIEEDTADDLQPTATRSIEDVVGGFSGASDGSMASQSIDDEQGFSVEDPRAHGASSGTSASVEMDVAPSQSGSRGKDSKDSQPVLSEEFFTTADINTHSVTPSIHSTEIEAASGTKTSSVPTTGATTRSVVSQEVAAPVAEFLTSADTIGESVAPSDRSTDLAPVQESSLREEEYTADGSLPQDLEEEEPLVVTQRSSSGSSSDSVSEEERGGAAGQLSSSRSAEVLKDSYSADGAQGSGSQGVQEEGPGTEEQEELIEYSDELFNDTADIEVEEPREEEYSDSAFRSRGGAGFGQTHSVDEEDEYGLGDSARGATSQDSALDVAATEDFEGTVAMQSADMVEDSILQRSAATGSAEGVSDGVAQPPTATGSTGIASEVPMQRSAATGSTTASALPDESQEDDYDSDFQPSVLPGQESSRQVLETTGAVPTSSRLVSTGDVVQKEEEPEEEDYDLDFDQSALAEVEVSSRLLAQPAGASASRLGSTGDTVQEEEADGTEVDDYELDFEPSALEVPSQETSRAALGATAAAASQSRLVSTGEMVQDASELFAQTSLRDVASASSIGSRRLPVTSQTSARTLPSALQQQASSVSASTYEEDFEAGHAGLGRTTLSVVEEEGETKADATGSKLYSEEFASASVLKSRDEELAPVAQPSLPAVRSATESAASEVQDVEYDYEVEDDEDEQQFSAGSTGLVGPVLPPAATNSVALEVSQRYGPAAEQSSGGYSDDFQDQPGQDTLASTVEEVASAAAADPTSSFAFGRDADKGLQSLMSEPRAESSLHRLATQSAERRVSAPSAAVAPQEPPPPVSADPSRKLSARDADESMSVSSEENPASATVSSEPSAQELQHEPSQSAAKAGPQEVNAAVPASGAAVAGPSPGDDGDDDYTRDFTDLHSNIEAQGSSNTVEQEPEKDRSLVSHPISQPPSPPARSDGGASSRAAAAAADTKENNELEEVSDEEDLPEEDLDMSDLGLDTPLAAALADREAAEPSEAETDAEPSVSAGSALTRAGAAEESSTSVARALDAEESGMIGRGIRVTRKIESMKWRSQQALLEDEDGGLSGDMDLMDMSMPGGEGSGLLDMLGADLITEASEANTPSHSFRIRSGDLTSAPSSGSPYGGRSALSVRLATLRESQDHEGEDAASAGVVSPSAARELRMSGESPRSGHAEGAAASSHGGPVDEAEEVDDEDEDVVPSQVSSSERSFRQPAPSSRGEQPPEPALERSDARSAVTAAEPLPEPSSATEAAAATATAREQPTREASGASSDGYSDDGLEAPPSQGSAGQQSVLEYDAYTSLALADDDSDDLKMMAAAFESQALDNDEDEDAGVAAQYSGVSASGLSDDLAKYKVNVHADSDEETGDVPRAAPAAPVPPPAPAGEHSAEAEHVPSVEASEVAEEEPEAAASDPFSVDESGDRLPTLQPAAAVQPPALLGSLAQPVTSVPAQPTAAEARAEELKSESATSATPTGPAAEAAPVAPSPTASSPRSERSSHGALPDETSLGPLPRSGLGGDDDEDGQDLKYSAVYQPHGEDSSKPGSPVPPDSEPATGLSPGEEATAAAVGEDGSAGKGGYPRGLADILGSDDEEDLMSGSLGGRGLSAASLKPVFQALLDQPEAGGDLPKGEFESEIEEMLAASRSRSRLMSPYQSRELNLDMEQQDLEGTPVSSARASQAGVLPVVTVLAAPPAAAASVAGEAVSRDAQEKPAAEATRDVVVDEITESTVKELVADAVEVMVGATAQAGSSFQAASGTAASVHRLPALDTEDEDEDALAVGKAAEDSSVSSGGEASISMSENELGGDIELDVGEPEDLEAGAALDLPSPIPSDSGSVGSPMRSYGSSVPKPSDASGATPALGPERSDRDLAAVSGSIPDENVGDMGDSGIGLNSDEDPGWGGTDLDSEEWQLNVSDLIAPAMDQAAIERENAPAVATDAAAVDEYASQVLEQFMDNRPEFLVPGAEPLSLEGFLDQERRLVHASEAQHIHNKMIYDAINEALLAIYRSANRIESQPWLRRNRIVKPLPSPAEMAKQVQEQLRAWAAMRMRDPAEKVLAVDALEDERARGDTVVEEAEVQREVADMIWAELVEDTARQLADLQELLAPVSTARGGMPTGGRRRLDALAP